MTEETFYIVDLRPSWRKNPCITVWRPNNAGYAYPLSWAGKYTLADLDHPQYRGYTEFEKGKPTLFPVPCAAADVLSIPKPPRYVVDGDAGPVLPNNKAVVAALIAARYVPTSPSSVPVSGEE